MVEEGECLACDEWAYLVKWLIVSHRKPSGCCFPSLENCEGSHKPSKEKHCDPEE